MRSLVYATGIDVLPMDRVVERRDGYTVVRSPSNPSHYWGNLLVFDDPPTCGLTRARTATSSCVRSTRAATRSSGKA